jgi:hypothetical protein
MTAFTIILAVLGLVEALSHHRQMVQTPRLKRTGKAHAE